MSVEYRAIPDRKRGYRGDCRTVFSDFDGVWHTKQSRKYSPWRPTPRWAIRALRRRHEREIHGRRSRAIRYQRRANRARRAST